jgi:transposase InsO family protein
VNTTVNSRALFCPATVRASNPLPLRDALTMALTSRQPESGVLHHSDRGSQYAAGDYQDVLIAHGMGRSMSRVGNCWDNAVAESFFATLGLLESRHL